MKIAVLSSSFLPVVGGRQVFAYYVSRQLSARGHEVDVYVPGRNYRELGPQYRDQLKPLPRPFFGLLRLPRSIGTKLIHWYLRRMQRLEKYDIWLVVAAYPAGHAAIGLKGAVPIVLRASGDDIQKSPELEYGLRLDSSTNDTIRETAVSFDRVVAMTGAARSEFLELGVQESSIANIPNGVDFDWFTRQRDVNEIRAELGWPTNTDVILSTGRNHPKKGFNLIPAIADKLREQGFHFRWYVIGHGTDALDGEIARRRLNEYVVTGHQVGVKNSSGEEWRFPDKELVMMYQAADVYAFPTLLENFAMVILEAMAAGAAFVSTDAPGCGELVTDERTGLIARAGDVDDFAVKLSRVLGKPRLRKALSENAREFAREYRWDEVARKYEDLFSDLIEPGEILAGSTTAEHSKGGR